MKIKFFKIKKNFKKNDDVIHINLFWNFLIIFSALLIITFFVFAYNIFVEVNKEGIAIVENDIKSNNKEKEKIKQVLEYFSEREKKSNEILNSAISIVDPSL